MLKYNDMVIWSKDFDILNNRKRIVNQLLGERYPDSDHCVLRVFYNRGLYHVSFHDDEIATFGVYDVEGLRDSLRKLDAWSDCVWMLSKSGYIAA